MEFSFFSFLYKYIFVRVAVAQSVQRLATGWTAEGLIFESWYGQEFSLLRVFQTGSGSHPASYPMNTAIKRQKREADHSPLTSADVKKTWIYTPTSSYAFMV
jgi:hypothetical protein